MMRTNMNTGKHSTHSLSSNNSEAWPKPSFPVASTLLNIPSKHAPPTNWRVRPSMRALRVQLTTEQLQFSNDSRMPVNQRASRRCAVKRVLPCRVRPFAQQPRARLRASLLRSQMQSGVPIHVHSVDFRVG